MFLLVMSYELRTAESTFSVILISLAVWCFLCRVYDDKDNGFKISVEDLLAIASVLCACGLILVTGEHRRSVVAGFSSFGSPTLFVLHPLLLVTLCRSNWARWEEVRAAESQEEN